MLHTQFGGIVKVFRSDNGSEFLNKECQSLFHELGIIHQISCTYTPQQNGRVERKHRHLLNVARALLFQAYLPIKFWGDAILTATYLINRTPSLKLNWKAPYELLHGSTSPSSSCPLPTVPLDLDSLHSDSIPSEAQPVAPSSLLYLSQIKSPLPALTMLLLLCLSLRLLENLLDIHNVLLASLSILQEPRSFAEAVMNPEIQALEKNYTWRVTPLPAGKKATGCKWIYKTKLKADGNVERYKARLVAKGFNQGYDVKPGLVCKLERSLYGLKLESQQWNLEFTVKLEAYGFVQSAHDYCLFTMITDFGRMFLLVYVDNILITGPSLSEIQKVKSYHYNLFTIKDLGDARYFLGLEISRNSSSTYLAQYTLAIIKDAGLLYSKAATTPLPHGSKFTDDCGAKLQHPDTYRRLIGRLLYLGFTRLDISHSVWQLSQFLARPCESHWSAALHIVKYLKGSPSQGIFSQASNNLQLRAFCDTDWAASPNSCRSLTGFCVFLGAAPFPRK
ncbi:Retrovirus-related Pol polyprotein from transposon RE2 [Sesamum angolense]|uniref:Retrovirus-related Pol polyprotein from transposon RE2 n=1 Tax=Sesamum angolense TaxID=2727404 RepID=A0AAE1WDT9_9LAMI|nr:Retrovirus-related Pol polyprotein from transposon RE2 [Sesamum angolense]